MNDSRTYGTWMHVQARLESRMGMLHCGGCHQKDDVEQSPAIVGRRRVVRNWC